MSTRPETRSIGHVLGLLKSEFPDISISKIRFLESEGLITPQRAPSGYRRYTDADIERLRYVLSVQKSHYLPLRVIREHLEAMDRGQPPPQLDSPFHSTEQGAASGPAPPQATKQPVRLSRAELLEASGLSELALAELERNQIVQTKRGSTHYGRDALTLAIAARRLSEYGIDRRQQGRDQRSDPAGDQLPCRTGPYGDGALTIS
jgi:DNA-binding transcriptional MerR regulator